MDDINRELICYVVRLNVGRYTRLEYMHVNFTLTAAAAAATLSVSASVSAVQVYESLSFHSQNAKPFFRFAASLEWFVVC